MWFHIQLVSVGITGNQALAGEARLAVNLREFADPLE
jgi:hypothetical protein